MVLDAYRDIGRPQVVRVVCGRASRRGVYRRKAFRRALYRGELAALIGDHEVDTRGEALLGEHLERLVKRPALENAPHGQVHGELRLAHGSGPDGIHADTDTGVVEAKLADNAGLAHDADARLARLVDVKEASGLARFSDPVQFWAMYTSPSVAPVDTMDVHPSE